MMSRGGKSAFADLNSDGEDSVTTPKAHPSELAINPISETNHPNPHRWSLRTPMPIYAPTTSGSFTRQGNAAANRPLSGRVDRSTSSDKSAFKNNHSSPSSARLPNAGTVPDTNATVAFDRATGTTSNCDGVLGASTADSSFMSPTSSLNPMSESRMALYTSIDWPSQPVASLVSVFEHGFDDPDPQASQKRDAWTKDVAQRPPSKVGFDADDDEDGDDGNEVAEPPSTPLVQQAALAKSAPTPGRPKLSLAPPPISQFSATPMLPRPANGNSLLPTLVTHFTRNVANKQLVPFDAIKPFLHHVPQTVPADMPYRKLSEVMPGLYLSGEAAVTEREKLLPMGMKLIITMNGEKHIPPYRVFEYNEEKKKFLHRKIASREAFVAEMKQEFRRLYRTGACTTCCGYDSAFPNGGSFTSAPCEACANPPIAGNTTALAQSTDDYALQEHRGACEDATRLTAYLESYRDSPTTDNIPKDSIPHCRIFVRSVPADDSPVYDLSPHFLEISCLTHIVMEEYRRVELLFGARQVRRQEAGIASHDQLVKERLPFQGPGVAIHCMAGVSRSTSVLAAYLMKLTRIDVEEVLTCIKNRRAIINPNPGFRRQLSTWQLQKYFIAHDEGACAMIARQIARAAPPQTERLDQGIGRLSMDEQLRIIEGLLTVYATTNRSTRERRNFGIIIKHLCVEPDRDAGSEVTAPALPLNEVTKLSVMFLREHVLGETFVDCPGLFTNWCEIVSSIIGNCGGRAVASTLLRVIAEKLQCRFTAVDMYRANISPITAITCDAVFGLSFLRIYEALAHESEEANRPIRRANRFTNIVRDLLQRMAPNEALCQFTEAELASFSGPGSPLSDGGGLYCGPTAYAPLLSLHHAIVATGLPRLKELLSAPTPGADYTPNVLRVTYHPREACCTVAEKIDSHEHPVYVSGSSPTAEDPALDPHPGFKRDRLSPIKGTSDPVSEEEHFPAVVVRNPSVRDVSYDVRGRTPATASTLVPLTMALDLFEMDGETTTVEDLDHPPVATPMPQNIVVSYPFLEALANFAVWERDAPAKSTPSELAELLGVSVAAVGGPHEATSMDKSMSSNSVRCNGVTLQLPSRRRRGDAPTAIAVPANNVSDDAAFQECMARLTSNQKHAIANAAILHMTQLCSSMRQFLEEVTGGGPSKPRIASSGSDATSQDEGSPKVPVTPLGLDLEATLFNDLVNSASDSSHADALEDSLVHFLSKRQTASCQTGETVTMWSLYIDALNFAKDSMFQRVIVCRLTGDIQLELIPLNADGEEDGTKEVRSGLLDTAFESVEGEVLQEIIKRKVTSVFKAFATLFHAW